VVERTGRRFDAPRAAREREAVDDGGARGRQVEPDARRRRNDRLARDAAARRHALLTTLQRENLSEDEILDVRPTGGDCDGVTGGRVIDGRLDVTVVGRAGKRAAAVGAAAVVYVDAEIVRRSCGGREP